MGRRCPPGVICIENITIVFILIILGIVLYYLKNYIAVPAQQPLTVSILSPPESKTVEERSYTLDLEDVLMNPYQAPLRNDQRIPTTGDPRGMPINIRTQGEPSTYRQVGILTKNNGEIMLQLMGKPLLSNRDKWNFYTMNDKNNMIKLPVTYKSKSCTNEYGCDNIYNGDTVYVEGYNDTFKATIYENQVMQYIPYL